MYTNIGTVFACEILKQVVLPRYLSVTQRINLIIIVVLGLVDGRCLQFESRYDCRRRADKQATCALIAVRGMPGLFVEFTLEVAALVAFGIILLLLVINTPREKITSPANKFEYSIWFCRY